jgi:hypothetical protein
VQTARKKRPEFGSRPSEARHHCASGTAQNIGDLLIGQLSILPHHDDLAKLVGKLLDCFSYLRAFHFAHIKSMRVSGSFDREFRRALIDIELYDLGRGVPMSQLIEPNVSQDREQPTLYITARLQSSHPLDSTNARFLYKILRFRAVMAENHGITVEPINQFIENLAEGMAFLGWERHIHVGHTDKGCN